MHAWPACDDRGVIAMVSLSRLQKALTEGMTAEALSEILTPVTFRMCTQTIR